MGLAERRAIEAFKADDYAKFVQQLKDITGVSIEIETNWDEVSKQIEERSDTMDSLREYFSHMFTISIVDALKSICSDKMGKEALTSAMKKIVIKCDSQAKSSENGFAFEKGILTVNMSWGNGDYYDDRTKHLIRILESKL